MIPGRDLRGVKRRGFLMNGSEETAKAAYETPGMQSGKAFEVEAMVCSLFMICATAEASTTAPPDSL
jgi:hypothetical protein